MMMKNKAKYSSSAFVGKHSRYDLMLVQTDRHYGKTLVLNMQTNQFGIIGSDDIEEEGYISYI